MSLQQISVALLFAMVIPAVLFPTLYTRSAWRQSAVGKSLMLSSVSFAAFLLVGLVFRVVGGQGTLAADIATVVVFGLVLVSLVYRLVVLLRLQRSKTVNSMSRTHQP